MATQALILAAGRGSRLGNNGHGVPKALLEVGRRTLVEHQLETLTTAGVGPIGMVVGYAADEIERALGAQVEYLHNQRWMTTNSLYSLALARSWVTGDLVLLNCDVLLDPEILDRLLARGGNCLAYDSNSGDGREHMKVALQAGRVVGISKTLDRGASRGENVGVIHLTKEGAAALFQAAEELLADGQDQAWVAQALERVARTQVIEGVDVAGLPWGEVNFSYDLERARRDVWPAIRRRSLHRRPLLRAGRWLLILAGALLAATLALRSFMRTDPSWEYLALHGIELCPIEIRGVPQNWYVLDAAGPGLEAPIVGPTEVRVNTRLILSAGATGAEHYVLVLALDGGSEEWHAIETRASGSARRDPWTIAKSEQQTLAIPEGTHRLRIRIEEPDAGRCLVRLRQLAQDGEH